MINPVQDITPDGRPMEGTAYPEHSAPGVSLDSGLRAGMSSLEPLQQSVLNTSLVARPQVEIRTSDWKLVINPGSGHYPGRSTYGGDYLPGASGSGGVSGQWTHGGIAVSGTIGAVSARSIVLYNRMRRIGQSVRLWHTAAPRTVMFSITGAADAGSEYS